MHPGQKNNLDALCKRYDIDNSQRDLHGALLDAEILAETYLAMTGGQTALSLGGESAHDDMTNQAGVSQPREVNIQAGKLKVLHATTAEIEAHESRLKSIDEMSGGSCVWFKEKGAESAN